MPNVPSDDRRCTVQGCHAWAVRGQPYCQPHHKQWQENLRSGAPDTEPRLVRRNRRLCAARSCRHLAVANSTYCPTHAAQVAADADNSEAMAEAFAALIAKLDTEAPDSLSVVIREADLLDAARRILVSHAEMSSRTGWKVLSSAAFVRLWLSSVATATDLAKTRFLIENASGADLDRLLDSVYTRLDSTQPPAQRPLPGLLVPADGAAAGGAAPRPLTTPHEQLAEWLLEANTALGTPLVRQALQAATEAEEPERARSLVHLIAALPQVQREQPADPAALADRLSTLSAVIAASPDPQATRALIEAARHV